ncbi:hypothetical protein Bpfe_013459 [Biomphalaria pfeifferi]|uniref:Uncharacterized protein n=1 Tax=Biomphalaria pfeifferi TaxID=112525 RepID=A0AAD8FAC3_BIOPF|nr:hypothetical protein Bpfe_013459 [Biomphalaria pfeifferi]
MLLSSVWTGGSSRSFKSKSLTRLQSLEKQKTEIKKTTVYTEKSQKSVKSATFDVENLDLKNVAFDQCREANCSQIARINNQCINPNDCNVCGLTGVENIYESLREGVYCADKKDVITLTNRRGGLLFIVRFPFLGQSWDFCQLGPLQSNRLDSAGRFVTLDKVMDSIQCTDLSCTPYNLQAKLCSLDVSDVVDQGCFDRTPILSVPISKEAIVLYFDENLSCKKCLLQLSISENKIDQSLMCFPMSVVPASAKMKRYASDLDKETTTTKSSLPVLLKKIVLSSAEIKPNASKADEPHSQQNSSQTSKPVNPQNIQNGLAKLNNRDLVEESQLANQSVTQSAEDLKNNSLRESPVDIKVPVNPDGADEENFTKKLANENPIQIGKEDQSKKPGSETMKTASVVKEMSTTENTRTTLTNTSSTKSQNVKKEPEKKSLYPKALTLNVNTNSLKSFTFHELKAPTLPTTTMKFEDLWNKRMRESEMKRKEREQFEAIQDDDDPPPQKDPFISMDKELGQSRSKASTLKAMNLVLSLLLVIALIAIQI